MDERRSRSEATPFITEGDEYIDVLRASNIRATNQIVDRVERILFPFPGR
jgi:hypothetical protein